MKTNLFLAIFPIICFFCVLESLHGTRKGISRSIQPACFNAPLWVYNEEKRAYYRQDWCKTSKSPIYWESIPTLERDTKDEKFLSQR